MSSPSFEEFLLDFLLDFNEDFSCFGRNIKQNRGKTQSSSWKVVMVCREGTGSGQVQRCSWLTAQHVLLYTKVGSIPSGQGNAAVTQRRRLGYRYR